MRLRISLILLLLLAGACLAQQVQANRPHPVYYDTFDQPWIDPNKWDSQGPGVFGNPREVIREIRGGQLRMVVRTSGRSDQDSGFENAQNHLGFANPTLIRSISADMTVRSLGSTECPANPYTSWQLIHIGGAFFNVGGTGDSNQDLNAHVTLMPFQNKLYGSLTLQTPDFSIDGSVFIGLYDTGQRLTASIQWDPVHHQFVGRIIADGVVSEGIFPYTWQDTTAPVYSIKELIVNLTTPNCTANRTFGYGEVVFDNVTINQ